MYLSLTINEVLTSRATACSDITRLRYKKPLLQTCAFSHNNKTYPICRAYDKQITNKIFSLSHNHNKSKKTG